MFEKRPWFGIVASLMLPAMFGCGVNMEEGDGPAAENEDIGVETEAIWGPNVRGRSAIEVRFQNSAGQYPPGCSGVILNNYTIVTAAHCLPGFNNGPRNVQIYYQRPGGDVTRTFGSGQMFFYVPSGWNSNTPAEWDVSVGIMAPPSSLSLSDIDFATLYRGGLGGGTHVTQAGYGGSLAGPSQVQRRIVLQVTWNGSQHVKWETDVAAGQMACRGDSGGPGYRSAGYLDASGVPYWDAAAWVMHGGLSTGQDCDDEGRASKLNTKVDWIRDIVEFWTPLTCTDFTTPSNQPAAWCWDVE
jgi:hypothetical protein